MRWIARSAATLLLLLLCVLSTSAAETPRAKPDDVGISAQRLQRIHELMQRHIDAGDFSGSVTLVSRNGRIAHLEAQGLMDIETKKPMTTDAMFRIMSMTKPIVGTAVLMLMEEGKIRLTDPVSKFIPEFKDLKAGVLHGEQPPTPPAGQRGAPPKFYTVPAEREITIKDLLTHTSGLVSGPISNSENAKVALKGKESNADYIPRLGQVPLEFQPGTRWAYSAQAGFDTLVLVVERASGMKFDQFASQRIFGPLVMKDTFFYPPESYTPRIATLYTKRDKSLVKQNNPNFMNGAFFSGGGGLFTTAEDYLQFGLMLLNGGQLNGKRLLAPRTVELMRSVFIPDTLQGRSAGESFGLSVRVVTNPMQLGTSISAGSFGWSGAYNTHFWVDPKEKVVAVMMTQISGEANRRLDRVDFENAVMQAIVEPAEQK
jgi:CubicO group peptidase (beta-lactamase class C family)